MATPDLTQLKHALVNAPLHFYTEVKDDGTEILRHIRVQMKVYEVPAEGITVDSLPADIVGAEQIKTGAVSTDEIKDGSIKAEDLADEVKGGLDELNNVSITDEELEGIFNGSDNSD